MKNNEKNPKIIMLLRLIFLTVLFVGAYFAAIKFGFVYIMHIYVIAAAVLAVVFFMMNGGYIGKIPKEEDLSDELSADEKIKYIEEIKERREKSKIILLFLFPLITALLLDSVYLFFIADKF